MKVAIMQPYFLPYLGYFQLIHASDIFVLFDDVNFIKKGWIHRNRILVKQGEHLFSLPLSKASQNKLVCDHKLVDASDFASKFTKLLISNYKSAPYYSQGMDIMMQIFDHKTDDLTTLCHRSIEVICKELGFQRKLLRSSKLSNNKTKKAADKVADIVNLLHGDVYINLPGGRELYNAVFFKSKGLELKFIQPYPCPTYPQILTGFVPNLSILDMLMSVSADQLKNWISNYELSN